MTYRVQSQTILLLLTILAVSVSHLQATATAQNHNKYTTASSEDITKGTCNNERRPENQAACNDQVMGTLVPYPGNCSQFLVCNCEYPTVKICPAGLWFDNNLKVCNYPQAVECDDSIGTLTTPTPTEPNDWGKDCVASEGMSGDICLKYDNGILLRYPYNCNAYINCTMGCPVMNYCQSDKVFNNFLKICDTPDTAQCEELPLPNTTSTEGPITITTEESITTSSELPITPPGNCMPIEGIESIICAGQAQGTFVPYPYNCSAYIVCRGECPYLEYCEKGKIFNALLDICDSPEGVICEELPLPTPATTTSNPPTTTEATSTESPTNPTLPPDVNPELCSSQPDNSIYPYEGDCSKYLQCQDGEVMMKSCPNGWLFNSQLMLCDQTSEDMCYTGLSTTEATMTTTSDSSGFELCIGQPENKTFPYIEDCSYYYFCRGNDLYYLLPCPNNNYYDPYSGNCGPSASPLACKETITTTTTSASTLSPSEKCNNQGAGMTFPYEANCQQYIFCNGAGGYWLLNCPFNNYYHPDSGNCGPSDDPEICLGQLTTTTLKPITTTEPTTITTSTAKPLQGICGNSSNGELIEYPDNCQKYISCVLPIPVAFYCNNNWYFNVEQQQCVVDTNGICSDLPSNTTTIQPPADICQGLGLGDWQTYENDCQLYYKCLGDGQYMLQICMEGEFFNPLEGQCSSEVSSEYCKENFVTTMPPETTVPPSHATGICAQQPLGGKIAYPENCFKYIVCDYPIPIGYNCPADLQFSLEQQACVEAIDSDCGIITTVTTPESTPTKPYSLCNNKTDFTSLPYEEDCAMFIICIQNSEYLAYCPPGQYFVLDEGICSGEADKDSCRKQEITTTEIVTNTTEDTTTTIEDTSTTTETITTTTEDPNLGPCYNKPDGTKLPYPNNCEKYIECRDPLPVGYDCPPGLEFSATLRECVAPELADCSIKTTLTPITTTTEMITTTLIPNTEETCEDKPNGATLPNPNDCSQYYMCVNGNARLVNCMPNTFYDPESGLCDRDVSPNACKGTSATTTTTEETTPETTTESKPTIETTTETLITTTETTTHTSTESTTIITTTPQPTEEPCNGQNNGYTYANENDCSRYYMCMNGSPISVRCTPNNYYNPLTGQCDDQTSSTACKETTATTETETPTTTIKTPTTTDNPQSDNICCGQKSGTKLPYPGDSTKYVICQYPLPQVQQCPNNGNYDSNTATCRINENYTTYPHPDCSQLKYGKVLTYEGDCTKYYFCFGNDAMVLNCSSNWYFSDTLKQCVPKDLYNCPW